MALFVVCLVEMLPRMWRGRDPQPESLLLLALSSLWLLGLGLGFVRRAWVRRRPMPPVVFGDQTVTLPLGPESLTVRAVRYDAILTVGQAERPLISAPWAGSAQAGTGSRRLRSWQHFFVEDARAVYSLPQPMFRDADGHERFFTELHRRIAALPQGTRALVDTERRRLPALLAMARKPWATQAVFGVAAVFYLNTWLKGALNAPFGLLRWGAVAPALLGHAGEAYRLCAASFLHGQWPHALVNALALRSLGTLTERLLGWQRMLLVYLVSGAAAMAASAWASEALMSVGASGALFGLLGAFAVLNVRMAAALPLGVRQPWPWWAVLLAINGGLSALVPVLDWVMHVTGFFSGVVLGGLMLGRRRELPAPAGRTLQAACLVVVAVYGAALVQAVARAARTRTGEAQVAHLLSHDARTPAATLNHFALYWAIDPHSSPDHLRAGQACAEQAVRREPKAADYRATLAELERRLGERRAACADWRRALVLAMDAAPAVPGLQPSGTLTSFYAAQLARNYAEALALPVEDVDVPATDAGGAASSVADAAAAPPGPSATEPNTGVQLEAPLRPRAATAPDGADAAHAPADAPWATLAHLDRPVPVRRDGADWVLAEPPGPAGFARRLWLVAGTATGPVALLLLERPASAQRTLRFAPQLRAAMQDCGASWVQLAEVEPLAPAGGSAPTPATAGAPEESWWGFRLPPGRDARD